MTLQHLSPKRASAASRAAGAWLGIPGMRENPGPALRAQFPGPRNNADDMLSVHIFHLIRGSWSERRVRGDPPNCGHWKRNLTADVDKKRNRLLVFGARPACAELPHGS